MLWVACGVLIFVDPTDRAWRSWDLALDRPDGQRQSSTIKVLREASLGPFINSLALPLLLVAAGKYPSSFPYTNQKSNDNK